MLVCKFCQEEYKNAGGLATHEPYCKENPNRIQRKKSPNAHRSKGSIPWNKGLSKDTDERIKSPPNKGIKGSTTGKGKTVEKETERVRKITEKAKLHNGGLREGSGRGKKGWYKGFYCRSSWELAFLVYHLDNKLNIKPCTEVRTYTFDNKIKKYYPDFDVDEIIYEIKGYKTKQWLAKKSANPDIIVLYEEEIKSYIRYATSKYGKEFTSLYE